MACATSISITDDLLVQIDNARGRVPRSAWIEDQLREVLGMAPIKEV